ncbi:MAG: amidohydrolase family protein [Deltaproteobacteria bacterium]|nr:amidohydrolase family protein [Deltaproteobacteria bacterium]
MSITAYKARFIAVNPKKILKNEYIHIEAGTIIEVSPRILPQTERVINLGDGIIISALINTHTHLELSAFKNQISYKYGFKKWVKTLLEKRENTDKKILIDAAKKAAIELLNTGCAVCAEISTLKLTKQIFAELNFAGVWFEEKLKNDLPDNFKINKTDRIKTRQNRYYSYAGHAPHTTSPFLLAGLKKETKKAGLPFSIHTAESAEETEFITTGKGEWAEFLAERNVDYKGWGLPAKSSVSHLENLNILDRLTILVHLTFASEEDLRIIKKRGANICLCPRSNYNLHDKLPSIETILKLGINACFGTDSLASADTLDILDETAFIAKKFPEISAEKLLGMATINGAKALGIEESYGTIEKGKKAFFLYLPVKASDKKAALKAALRKQFNGKRVFIDSFQ